MKWLLVVVLVLAALAGLVALVGSRLPKEHSASVQARFAQPPEAVWQAISDLAQAPAWRSDLKSVERQADELGKPVWVEVGKQGRMRYVVEESLAPVRMVTRIADPKLPFGGSWTYDIAPQEGGCTLTLTEDGEIYNVLFRFMARYAFGYDATMKKYLRDLGRHFGEDTAPARIH